MVKADDIVLFARVVEAGSFTKVAEQLKVTNSVVSKRIARLEQALNVQLLYRTTRKLGLTEAGNTLFHKASLAKLALQEAEDALTGFGDTVRGTIKLSMPVVSSNILLSDALARFTDQHPQINVELVITNSFVDLIEESFDLAIRTAELKDSSLIARRLVDSQWLVCASPNYLYQHPPINTPEDLANHHCLIYKFEGTGHDQWLFHRDQQKYHVTVKGRFQSNNLNSLREAVLANLGIAYLPKALIYQELQQGKLQTILSDQAAKNLGIYALYPKTRQPDLKIKLLIEYFREALQTHNHWFN